MYEEDYIPTTTTEDPDYYDVFSILGKRSAPSFTEQDTQTNMTQPFAFQYIEYPNMSISKPPSLKVRFFILIISISLYDAIIFAFQRVLKIT